MVINPGSKELIHDHEISWNQTNVMEQRRCWAQVRKVKYTCCKSNIIPRHSNVRNFSMLCPPTGHLRPVSPFYFVFKRMQDTPSRCDWAVILQTTLLRLLCPLLGYLSFSGFLFRKIVRILLQAISRFYFLSPGLVISQDFFSNAVFFCLSVILVSRIWAQRVFCLASDCTASVFSSQDLPRNFSNPRCFCTYMNETVDSAQ